MSEWKAVKLGDVSEIRRGSSPRPIVNFMAEEGMPWVKIADATESGSKYIIKTNQFIKEEGVPRSVIVEPGDLILSNSGTAGLPKFMSITACIHDGWQVFKNLKGIDKDFLYYSLINIRAALLHNAYDSTMKNLTLDMVRDAEIQLPPLEEQKRIAAILSAIDDKIELNGQTNQALEHIAQAIFKSWFVDFEPTRAKIAANKAGQDPERAAMAAISGKSLDELDQLSPGQQEQLKKTATLFPDALVDSELGEIPEDWDASTLGEHFNVVMGQSPKGDTYNEEGEGMLFFQGRRDFGFRYPTPRIYTTEPKRLAQAGDTLISVRAPVGDRNMADQECCLGRGVAGIRHKTGARSFTYAFIGHIESSLSDSGSDGTVFSSINKKELGAVSFVAPYEKLVSHFESIVESIDERIEVDSKEIETLEELRDSILPKLLSGELEVIAEEAV